MIWVSADVTKPQASSDASVCMAVLRAVLSVAGRVSTVVIAELMSVPIELTCTAQT